MSTQPEPSTTDRPERKCKFCCMAPGRYKCVRCQEARPRTLYCGPLCQKQDWKFHKKYCGKTAYRFTLTLFGTSSPVITRKFSVPSWYTFRQLHYTLQYAMGPWQLRHLHEFAFVRPPASGEKQSYGFLDPKEEVLKVLPKEGFEEAEAVDRMGELPGMPRRGRVRREREEELKLEDVFGEEGRLAGEVREGGRKWGLVFPLVYTYDLGDNWAHELIFKGEKMASESRPLFTTAIGCAPVEDCGGPSGWADVKSAFSTRTPTREQLELRAWARAGSGLGEAFDPLKDPVVRQMNYEGRWENHLEGYMEQSGERVLKMEEDEEEEGLWTDEEE